MTTLYKFTNPDRGAIYGRSDYPPVGEWSQPRTPVLCRSGWHIPKPNCLGLWVGAELWEVEVRGAYRSDDNKSAHEQIRFIRKVEEWTANSLQAFANFLASQVNLSADSYNPNDQMYYIKDQARKVTESLMLGRLTVATTHAREAVYCYGAYYRQGPASEAHEKLSNWILDHITPTVAASPASTTDPLDSILKVIL